MTGVLLNFSQCNALGESVEIPIRSFGAEFVLVYFDEPMPTSARFARKIFR